MYHPYPTNEVEASYQFDYALRNRGAVFLSIFVAPPTPELHKTDTILKHWNRTTEYAKTGYVPELVPEIHALVYGPKKRKSRKNHKHVVSKISL